MRPVPPPEPEAVFRHWPTQFILPGMSAKNQSPSDHRRRARDRAEYQRGQQEAASAIERLQALLPAAFPKDPQSIKPLPMQGLNAQIAAVTGWTTRYVAGVLAAWRMRDAYYAALLRCECFHDLNGQPIETAIEALEAERLRVNQQRA